MTAPAPRFLPLLFLLFVGSGCAALIYEIVWLQLLQLVIGSSAISIAVLLGTFMGGMCVGSLALPRLVSAAHHPLRVYGWIELGIAVLGIAVNLGMPALGDLYLALLGHGLPGIALRALVCALCLLPPTILMGATLPAIARWIQNTPRGISWLGLFYSGNTLGAVGGCLLAGFYLLRIYDSTTATFWAAGLNAAVGVLALQLARWSPHEVAPYPQPAPVPADVGDSHAQHRILVALALSGLCALAAEVIWTRVLSLIIGATVYTFSIILAVFLAGLGLGSSTGATLARHVRSPRLVLAGCQLMQTVTLAWAAYAMASLLPFWGVDLATQPLLEKFGLDLGRCAIAILPSAILWGASFPLALAGVAGPSHDQAQTVARAYSANTVGAIAGALLGALVLIPSLGTRNSQAALIILSAISALLALWPTRWPERVAGLGGCALALGAVTFVPVLPWQLVAYGRQAATSDYAAHALYLGEGMNSSVAVSQTSEGDRFFHVSGKTEASSLAKDMRLQRMLGHLPALLHPKPRSVLIVGCGAGITSGSFVLHPSVERIVICDIEPLIPKIVAAHFREENHEVIRDPRVEIIYDDARHYIATTRETFDIITSDPIHPWVKGSAVLYSEEYFKLCRQRLNPGGLMTQWVPLYEADHAVVQSEMATFFTVFPHATVWANDDDGYGYDTVMLGQTAPLRVDVDALQDRFDRTDHGRIQVALADLGLGSALHLLRTYAGRYDDLQTWLAGAEINRDRNLRLQYLAGLQLDSEHGMGAYQDILSRMRFPSDIFTASPPQLARLRTALSGELELP